MSLSTLRATSLAAAAASACVPPLRMTSLAFATATAVALAVASSVMTLLGFVPTSSLIFIDDDLGLASPLFAFDFRSMVPRVSIYY